MARLKARGRETRVAAVLFALVLLILAALLLWALTSFVGGRTSRALAEAAHTLGLEPAAPGGGREAASDVVYAGTVDGVPLRIGAGRRVTTTVQPTIVTLVGVAAALPRPLDFELEIRVAALGMMLDRSLRLEDRQFDSACIVFTKDPEAARAALASAEARAAIREFVKRGGPSAVVTGSEVYVPVFNAHLRGARVLVDAARRGVRVARALSER